MRTRNTFLTAAILGLTTAASAAVAPENAPLPNYDVRGTVKGLSLGSAPSRFRAQRGAKAHAALSSTKSEALARLRQTAGEEVVVRWDELTAMPKVLFRYEGPITAPDWRDPADIARTFLRDWADLYGMEADAIDTFVETKRMSTASGGLTIVHLEQYASGINVFHGEARFAMTEAGEIAIVSTGDPLASVAGLNLTPAIDAADAVWYAAGHVDVGLSAPLARINPTTEKLAVFERGPFMQGPMAEVVLFPLGGTARLAYKVFVERRDTPDYYEVIVDAADGSLLHRHNMTSYVDTSGLVFREHPDAQGGIPQFEQFYDDTVLTDPRWPLGWVDGSQTIGNVVDSKDDHAGDNELTEGQRSVDFPLGPPITFQDPWNNSWESTGDPRPDTPISVTQIFYLANIYHDWIYDFGFDEAAGNWQNDNFGRGGKDGDRLFGDAQDSYLTGGRNNANMQTPPDGFGPRAQFFLFTPAIGAQRDPGMDGDVVIHEFTHGLSNRLIGSANSTSCLSGFHGGAMGEGWSDFYAISHYDEPRVGEYGTNNSFGGIRSDPYDAYPICHQFTAWDGTEGFCSPVSCAGICPPPWCPDDCQIHDEGQLWAATLWEMTTLLRLADPANGLDHAVELVTDGMKLATCGPTYLDARDAILLADRYRDGGIHQCLIWEAFKDRNMGFSASTTSVDDKQPAGATDFPPMCLTEGEAVLDLDTYACLDSVIATVHDGNATGPVQIQLRSLTTGDTETVDANGVQPTFSATPVALELNPAANPGDGILQVQEGDTIEAEYVDSAPAGSSVATADVSCLADVTATYDAAGGCSPDGSAWPAPIPEILDAGEIVDVTVIVQNHMPRVINNAQLTISSSEPMVVPLDSTASLGSIGALTGTGTATFRVAASQFLTSGTYTLDVAFTGEGFSGAVNPIQFDVPVMSDYQIVSDSTVLEDFEASDGGYTHYAWPGSPGPDEWQWGSGCGAASGVNAWYAGPATCTGDAQNQDANLEAPIFNPLNSTRVSWYPTSIDFQHRMSIASTDQMVFILSEPDFLNGGDLAFGTLALLGSSFNTGGSWTPLNLPADDPTSGLTEWPPGFSINGGVEVEKGLFWFFDFWTSSGAQPSQHWGIDDVQLHYEAADAVPQAAATCTEVGYIGSLNGCTAGMTVSAYNTQRPAEMQFSGNGAFFESPPSWNLFDVEFPTPSLSGQRVVLLGNANPDDAVHQGQLAINMQAVSDPDFHDFGVSDCADIPTPIGPAAPVAQGQPIQLSWTPFAESGLSGGIVGYEVWRIDAETFPANVSTIDDYATSGVLLGTTVGQADINLFVDTAPTVSTPPLDEYTYVIRPLFRCDGAGCTGPVPAEFGGSESAPGRPNVSTDSWVSDGSTTMPGNVQVSVPLLASFLDFGARRDGRDIAVEWTTATEIDTIGYYVYRGATADAAQMTRVSDLIPAHGPGPTYRWLDTTAAHNVTHFYQIREVAVGQASRTDVFALEAPGRGNRSTARGRGQSLRGADDAPSGELRTRGGGGRSR